MKVSIAIVVNREPDARRPDVSDVLRSAESAAAALSLAGHRAAVFSVTPELYRNPDRLLDDLGALGAGVILNFFEGFEDRPETEIVVTRLLRKTGARVTGNLPETLETCLDKARARSVLAEAGIPVPEGRVIRHGEGAESLAALELPLFLKPAAEDGSVGIDADSLARTPKELERSLATKLAAYPAGVIVERFLSGPEFAAGFVGLPGSYRAVGVSVLDYAKAGTGLPPFLSYDSKWAEGSREYTELMPRILVPSEPADRDPFERARAMGERAGAVLGCSGYFRVDMREEAGSLHVLEVNPNPDISPEAGFMRMAAGSGLSYAATLELVIESAR